MFSDELHKLCKKYNIISLKAEYYVELDNTSKPRKISFKNDKLMDLYFEEIYSKLMKWSI